MAEETPSGQDTSAKESVGDSPRVALRGRKCKHSSERSAEREKMVVTAETMEEGEAMGEPVFQAKRKDIVKGKDIGNRASQAKRKATETAQTKPISIQEQLSAVFPRGPVCTNISKKNRNSSERMQRTLCTVARDEEKEVHTGGKEGSTKEKGRSTTLRGVEEP